MPLDTLGTLQNPFKETERALSALNFFNTLETSGILYHAMLKPCHRLDNEGVFLRRPNTHMHCMIMKNNTTAWTRLGWGDLRGIANNCRLALRRLENPHTLVGEGYIIHVEEVIMQPATLRLPQRSVYLWNSSLMYQVKVVGQSLWPQRELELDNNTPTCTVC